ncbi:MAG: hypothetical protein ABH823_05550, partial [bacterium]
MSDPVVHPSLVSKSGLYSESVSLEKSINEEYGFDFALEDKAGAKKSLPYYFGTHKRSREARTVLHKFLTAVKAAFTDDKVAASPRLAAIKAALALEGVTISWQAVDDYLEAEGFSKAKGTVETSKKELTDEDVAEALVYAARLGGKKLERTQFLMGEEKIGTSLGTLDEATKKTDFATPQ